jgi:hypothetical protein
MKIEMDNDFRGNAYIMQNEECSKFHMALGSEEANRIICFRKDI